jgi:hypothetical protein
MLVTTAGKPGYDQPNEQPWLGVSVDIFLPLIPMIKSSHLSQIRICNEKKSFLYVSPI